MTTKQVSKQVKATPQKMKNEKYRVIPNCSLRGSDIISRLKNRTLIPQTGQYALDEAIDATRRMNKIDVAREALSNSKNIHTLQQKANELAKKIDNENTKKAFDKAVSNKVKQQTNESKTTESK